MHDDYIKSHIDRVCWDHDKAVMFRNSDNQVSCVNPSSVAKLVQCGWGTYDLFNPVSLVFNTQPIPILSNTSESMPGRQMMDNYHSSFHNEF